MKEYIKIERALLARFLLNVHKCTDFEYPEYQSAHFINVKNMLKQIENVIKEQDEEGQLRGKTKYKEQKLF